MGSVTLDQVRKVYPNGLEAVKPCSFTVDDGEFMVLVGPSGCGKSTLLRMVAGLENITEGNLHIADRLVNDVDPAHRDIAMVFQNYALYPHMTVAKNMGYGLKNRGIPKAEIERKVQEAAAMLDLEQYLSNRPSELSGGQRQRVAMGRAIVRSPQLFLFDEPLSNLDAKLRNQMRIEIRGLQRRLGVTSMYVTHDQVEAMTLADRIIVLNGGRIEQIGTPSEIYNHPQSTFVAGFMGAPPMNIINAIVRENQIDLSHGLSLQAAVDQSAVSGEVSLGIRPEDVRLEGLHGASGGGSGRLPFEIQIIEELGANRLLHGQLGGQSFSISVPKDTEVKPGNIDIAIRPEDMHWFDSQSGLRL